MKVTSRVGAPHHGWGAAIARGSVRRAALAVLASTATGAAGQGLAPLDIPADRTIAYFIEPPPAEASARITDRELASWAIETWEAALGGALRFSPTDDEASAVVRLHWAAAAGGQYGEMRPLEVDGRRGAAVFVRPDTDALGPDIAARARRDSLFRDTIVYLTCVHELGHALGLEHTAEFADIMYAFGYGGDLTEYFERFRRRLDDRADVRTAPLLSVGDLRQLRDLYPGAAQNPPSRAN